MQKQPATILPPDARSARIQKLAYQLWEEAGRPDGDDLTFWLCAETQINQWLREEAAGLPAAPEVAAAKIHLNGRFPASPSPEVPARPPGLKAKAPPPRRTAVPSRAARAS